MEVSKATLRLHAVRINQEMPALERVLLKVDGTGVPMVAREVEGVAGKHADCTAKTRERK